MGKISFKDLFKTVAKAKAKPMANDPTWAEKLPLVHFLMTEVKDDDGKARETCLMTILAEDGRFKIGLKDRTMNASLWRSGETVAEALGSLQAALAAGEADWRVASDFKKRK